MQKKFLILLPVVIIALTAIGIGFYVGTKSGGAAVEVPVASDSSTATNTVAEEKSHVEPGTVRGRIVDQYGVPFSKPSGTDMSGFGSGITDVSIVDALGDYAGSGSFNEDDRLILYSGDINATHKLPQGEYTFLVPGLYGKASQPAPWDCLCFPKKVDVEVPESGLDLGDIELVRFAKVKFGGIYNEVGTPIGQVNVEYRNVQVTDVSADRPYWQNLHGYYTKSGAEWTDSLPPGKFTLEVMAATYVDKLITFEVADKDINLGKIVLKKK